MANNFDLKAIDKVGKRRFNGGLKNDPTYYRNVRGLQDRLLNNLPSNYTKSRSLNIGVLFGVIAKELGLVQQSVSDIGEDKYHESTRIEYLFQILGDSLFLGEKSINEGLSDVTYRDFLIKVRNAYLGGSRKDNIERSVSDIVGLPVSIKEAYLNLRKEDSFYTLKDTHKMFFDIFMDESDTSEIGILLSDIVFFIDLIKPAHVIYDTRLIWTEELYQENICEPEYIGTPISETVYNPYGIYIVTNVASIIRRFSPEDNPDVEGTRGVVLSIDRDNNVIRLEDKTKLVYDVDTLFYRQDLEGSDVPINELDIQVGDVLWYIAKKDSSETSSVIQDTWEYSGIVSSFDLDKDLLVLEDGSTLVYNDLVYIFTRDGFGEYRTKYDTLIVGDEIAFKADLRTEELSFYNVPESVQNNYYKQFDRLERNRPNFIGNVKKEKDLQEGTEEGSNVIVEDGVLKVVYRDPRFYKRKGQKSFKAKTIIKYSLIIDGVYKEQFDIDPSEEEVLTEDQARDIFREYYGYDEIGNPKVSYEIKIARTGKLVEDGSSSTVQAIGDRTEICDRSSTNPMVTFYEDIRDYCAWPSLKLASGFFLTYEDFGPLIGDSEGLSVPGKFVISADPNYYTMAKLPLLDSSGGIATKDDLTVYLDGVMVEDAVEELDPWLGTVTLNFIPPFNTKLRVDYYHADRFPVKQDFVVYSRSSAPLSEVDSLGGYFNVVEPGSSVKRLLWPFPITDENLYGNDLDYQVNKFPILSKEGNLATKDDVKVYVGTFVAKGTLELVSVNEDNTTDLRDSVTDLSGVTQGDTIVIEASNYLDNTLIYTVKEVDGDIIRIYNAFPTNLAPSSFSYSVISYSEVEDSVEDVRPLFGHIKINFIPPLDSILKFEYKYTHKERNYLVVPDPEIGLNPGEYGGVEYISDAYYGPRTGYTLLGDPITESLSDEELLSPIQSFTDILEIGYRYRAFNLANSSVLNSRETLSLNSDPFDRAMILNNFSLMFSHEHRTDQDQYAVLNDKYLEKNLDPVTKLKKGTPIFPQTFTDDTHYRRTEYAKPTSTPPVLTEGRDIGSGFNIINPDESGLIDYNAATDLNRNKRITLYSNLKIVETDNGGYDAPLSSICEGDKTIPFNLCYVDEYFPNREHRLNEYYDFINQIPVEYKEGEILTLNRSKIIKTKDNNFLALRRGDELIVKDVVLTKWSDSEGAYVEYLKDENYTIVDIIDYQTARVHKAFEGEGGQYSYEVTRSAVVGVDVNLVDVNRALIINGDIGHTYGLPDYVLKALPGYGVTGINYELSFPDPDPDPTPISPSDAIALGLTGPAYDPNPITEEDYDTYKVPTACGEGNSRSYSETEYRVRWRNWDQEMILVTFPNRFDEDPIYIDDDIGEGIRRSYWKVDTQEIVHIHFFGSVLVTSEDSFSGVLAASYTEGLIPLTQDQVDRIQYYLDLSQDPSVQIPEYKLNESNYNLKEQIIYEVLHDNSVKTTEIQELEPLP
jgi:hypothetical protein